MSHPNKVLAQVLGLASCLALWSAPALAHGGGHGGGGGGGHSSGGGHVGGGGGGAHFGSGSHAMGGGFSSGRSGEFHSSVGGRSAQGNFHAAVPRASGFNQPRFGGWGGGALRGNPAWGGWGHGFWSGGRHWWPRWGLGGWGWVPFGPYYGYSAGGYGYNWYYCSPNQSYYPDVGTCPAAWTMVPAVEPQPVQSTAQPEVSRYTFDEDSQEGASQGGYRPEDSSNYSSPARAQPPPAPVAPPPPAFAAPQAVRPSPTPAPQAVAPAPSRPDVLYRWTDQDGTVSYTNRYDSIPAAARSNVQTFRTDQGTASQRDDDGQ